MIVSKRPIADIFINAKVAGMWPRDQTEWRFSFCVWLGTMAALLAFGVLPAALTAMCGTSALMLRRWIISRR